MLIPYGLVEAEVHRTPWVSVGLGSICVAVYIATLFADPIAPTGAMEPLFEELQELGGQGGFKPAPACRPLFGDEALPDHGEGDGYEAARRGERAEHLCKEIFRELDKHPVRKYAYVPARGKLQIGLLTAIFLHGGLLHLLGNLLFFFVCGPFLEDLWGRPFFLVFFLLGGAGAALAQGAADSSSYVHMVGASGSIAACMGAITFRYPMRHVKMLLLWWFLLRPIVYRFKMKVWLWGGLWVFWEIVTQATGGQPGVATMAHIGGFFVGVAVVLGLKHSGIEAKVLAPAVDKARNLIDNDHPEVTAAELALEQGKVQEAARRFEKVLREEPKLELAMWGAIRAWQAAENVEQVRRAYARLVRHYVSQRDEEGAVELVRTHGHALTTIALPPSTAEGLAALVERQLPDEARALRSGGPPGGGAAPALDRPVLAARFAAVTAQGVVVETEGVIRGLQPADVEMVAVGLLPGGRLLLDLYLRASESGPASVLRMQADRMGLEHFGSAEEPQGQVFARTVESLLRASGARAVPSPQACTTGPFSSYPDVASFQAASRTSAPIAVRGFHGADRAIDL